MVLIQIEPCGAETIGRLFAAKIGARGEKDNILLGRTVGEADKNEDEYAEKNQLVLSADLYEKLKQNDSGLSSLFKKKNGGVYYTESGYRGYLSQESRKQLKHDNAHNNYNKAWGYSLTEIESARKYVKDVFADIQQARETYPFIEATLLPTVDPVPIQLKVAAVNKSLLERTHAKREDFAGPYSRELEIIVPFDYKKAGCKVYGGKWIDTKLVKEEYQHFNDKRKDGCYLFCVGVPESFPQMENVILENIRTAEKMLMAYFFYLLALSPKFFAGKNTGDQSKNKKCNIFYEDIKDYKDAEDYISAVRKISENQFVDDVLRETYYNSKICSTKMHRFKIGLWTAFASIVLILICALCYFQMYHH